MSTENVYDFIEQALKDISIEYNIPESVIPQLVGLLHAYPDVSKRGNKSALRGEIEKLIDDLKNQGRLD